MKAYKLVYLDSSFLISIYIQDHPFNKEAVKTKECLEKKNYHPCFSSLAFDEVIFTLRKYEKKVGKGDFVKKIVEEISKTPVFYVSLVWNRRAPVEIFRIMDKTGLGPRAAVHIKTMLDNNIKAVVTFDRDFQKAKKSGFIKEVINFI